MHHTVALLFLATLLAALLAAAPLNAGGFEPFPVTPPPLTIGPVRPTLTPTPAPVYVPLIENGA